VPSTSALWPLSAREHVDLWFHGFALVEHDSSRIPLFAAHYGDSVGAAKARSRTLTQLDANRAKLASRFLAAPELSNAQFVALYFGSWEDLRQGADLFLRANGEPRSAGQPAIQQIIATFAAYFPTAPDRDWLRLFVQSLDDERTKFFHAWWQDDQRAREGVRIATDSLWQRVYRRRLQGYLNNTRQRTGDLVLATTLGAEGRTVVVGTLPIVSVGFPRHGGEAREVIYVFAHEVVSAVTTPAIEDNTTPAEQRSGAANRWSSNALVRGGLMLLQRVAPELADGYARFYLRSATIAFSGDAPAALAAAFTLPDAIRDGISRQLDIVLGGI
jgi:hypothetical protein